MIYLWIYLHYACIYKSYFCYTGKNKHTMTIILIENLLIVMIKIHCHTDYGCQFTYLYWFFFLLETLHYGIMNWRLYLTVTWILQCWRTGVFTCFVSDDMTHFRPGCTSGTVNAGLSLDPQGHPIFQRQRKTLSRKCY